MQQIVSISFSLNKQPAGKRYKYLRNVLSVSFNLFQIDIQIERKHLSLSLSLSLSFCTLGKIH